MSIIEEDKNKNVVVLIESPNKKETETKIFKDLGYKNIVVLASYGHIQNIKDTKNSYFNTGIYPNDNFKANYEVDESKKENVNRLKERVKLADIVYLATDPDYEGSSIAYSLIEVLSIKKYRRLLIHAITKTDIKNAIENSTYNKLDLGEVDRARTRQKLDKLLGYRLSDFSRKNVNALSVGRCQSVALKLVVEKEKEIQDFKPKTYYDLYLDFDKNKTHFKAKYYGEEKASKQITSKEKIEQIKSTCKEPYIISKIETKEKLSNPKPPFTTSTFQQEVSSKLGVSIDKAMSIAQKLFEGINVNGEHIALITYIRTDSPKFSPEFIPILEKYVKDNFGEKYFAPLRKVKEDENAQEGHEAIRPVDLTLTPSKLEKYIKESDLLKVYTMIYNRTLATMMSPSITSETTYFIKSNTHQFTFTSKELIFDGYLKIYNYDKEKDEVCKETFSKGEELKNTKLSIEEKKTNPPSRYTQATLVKKLENSGVGRPSTYATIISTILDPKRNYCVMENKTIKPTELGIQLSNYLAEHFSNLINVNYTSELEKDLDLIAKGEIKSVDFLNSFYNTLEESVKKVPTTNAKELDRRCPLCNNKLVIRTNRKNGTQFIGCSSYPKCTYTEKIKKGE